MKNLISISGQIGAGKDLVGTIIQYLIWKNKVEKQEADLANYTLEDFQRVGNSLSNWKIKKFADKLKDIVCILLGCSRADLEDREFKEKELSEEWWYWKNSLGKLVPYLDNPDYNGDLIKLTPRLVMQLTGTECFRDIIHPNTWVNALFSEYVVQKQRTCLDCYTNFNYNESFFPIPSYKEVFLCPICKSLNHAAALMKNLSNWIITDARFHNELEAVKKRGGITIRINRVIEYKSPPYNTATPNQVIDNIRKSVANISKKRFNNPVEKQSFIENSTPLSKEEEEEIRERLHKTLPDGAYVHDDGTLKVVTGKGGEIDFRIELIKQLGRVPETSTTLHESETALDSAQFDYILENNSDLISLIEKVRVILEKENII